MKPKRPQKQIPGERQSRDFFQTPFYAVDILLPYIPKGIVWEPAAGNGKITQRLNREVYQTDVAHHPDYNFLTFTPLFHFDLIITNPPFSLKKKFFNKCMEYGKPFALLLPIDFNQWLVEALFNDKIQWLIPTMRIDYITPRGLEGEQSSANFHSAWLCYDFNLPKQITPVRLTKEMKEVV